MDSRLGLAAYEPLIIIPDGDMARRVREVPNRACQPSRRDAVMLLGAGAAAMLTGVGVPRKANANPALVAIGVHGFVTAVNWFLDKVVGPRIGVGVSPSDVAPAPPNPTDDAFHNSHASPLVINNVSPQTIYSNRYGFHAGVDRYLRADREPNIPICKDLNTSELTRIRHINQEMKKEQNLDVMLFPCGFRFPPNIEHQADFRTYCGGRNDLELTYCRPMNDGHGLRLAYGMRSKLSGATDFLISNKPA